MEPKGSDPLYPESNPERPLKKSVEGILRYIHGWEYHPIWRTSQAIARLSGSTVPGQSDGLTVLDHHIQACYLITYLSRHLSNNAVTIIRAYYLPDTEVAEPAKEIACARVAERVQRHMDDPGLNRDWVWDLVRGWAGLQKWRTHKEWAEHLSKDRKCLYRRRYGSTEVEGIEEVLEQWLGEAKGEAAVPLRQDGFIGEVD